jgi:transposase
LDYEPRPAIPPKKNARDRLISWASLQSSWAIGFLDEVWWSRFALPHIHAWQAKDQPVRLVEQPWKKGDPDPKAFACYGVLWQRGPVADPIRKQMSLRFVTGRPVSAITTQFLEWCCKRLQAQGKTSWLLIWDNASFHASKIVRTWIREHNHQVKQEGKGVRILPFFLPTKSPWLNPIEPKWVHAKKALVEPNGLLSAQQLADRICAHFGCSYEPPLSIVEEGA